MEWFSRNRIWITGIGFFIASATLRFLSGNQTVHPTGWDGYYYVMQVHSLITYGHMQSPDFSLIYPFFSVITFVVGDPILGFKIGTALISGLLTFSVFYYLLRRDVALTIICAACSYIVFSPLITYFGLQFPKNALGLVFFVFFMTSLKRPGIMTAVLFLCTILTHRMTGAFALIVTVVYALHFVSWKWIVAGVLVVIALGFLPGIIHISDLARFDGQFTSTPHWAPYEFTKIFPTSLNWLFKADLIIISIIIILSPLLVIVNRESRIFESWIWFSLILISIFPFMSFSPGNIGHRFFMISPVSLVIFAGLNSRPVRLPSLVIAGSFIILSIFSYRSYKPRSFDAPNEVYRPIVDRLVSRYNPADYPLVIAHKGLAEIIIFKTDFDALNWLPPDDPAKDRVLRITHNVLSSDFTQYLDEVHRANVRTIGPGYFAVKEDTWQMFVSAAKKDNKPGVLRRIFSGDNPMDPRPYFISKGKSD